MDEWFEAMTERLDAAEPVSMTLDMLAFEAACGVSLPETAFGHREWWAPSRPHARWVRYGWAAYPDCQTKRVTFVWSPGEAVEEAPPPVAQVEGAEALERYRKVLALVLQPGTEGEGAAALAALRRLVSRYPGLAPVARADSEVHAFEL